ncbi:MAG TPA: ABC-2 family transporter protein [Candidatus Nanoarchaeia archaeon]|nr:ABC-2 family transporter protein [Candidatus Nanoarchaeia archaeon]
MNFKRFIKLYFQNLSMELSSVTTYRVAFFLNSLSLIIGAITGPLAVLFIYNVSPGFNGWTFPEMLVFLGTIQITFGLTHALVLGFSWVTADLIINGRFDTVLLNPVNTLGYMLSRVIDFDGFVQMITGLVILIIGLFSSGYNPDFTNWLFFAFLVIDGFLLWFAFSLLIGSLCFKYERSDEWFTIIFNLAKFGDYPLSIYGSLLSFVFTFIIPLGLISYYPANFLLGKLTDIGLFFELTGLMLVITFLAVKLYSKSLKNYSSAGG